MGRDGHVLGIVEAKKLTLGPQNVLTQAERYSKGATANPLNYSGYRVPFLYSTNGEVIWFRDVRHPMNRSRKVAEFHTPAAISEMMTRDLDAAVVNLRALPNTHPKYLFPGRRERDGVIHDFRKSMLVYNLHRLGGLVDELIIVEGFASVWWLHQQGHGNVVALMGSSCSPEQASLIAQLVSGEGRLWLMPDGDDAGAQLAAQALPLLAAYRFTCWVQLDQNQQPTDCDRDDLANMLGARKSAHRRSPALRMFLAPAT